MPGSAVGRRVRASLVAAAGWMLLSCVGAPDSTAIAGESPLADLAPGPQLLFTDILSGPNRGGEDDLGCYLSIFGRGLGDERGDSTVHIGGNEVAAYKYWGPAQYANGATGSVPGRLGLQQVTVQLGANVSGGAIELRVGGKLATGEHSFTVRPGKIFFVAPGEGKRGVVGNIERPFRGLDATFHRGDFKPGDFIVLRGGRYVGDGKNGRWLYIRKPGGASAATPYTVHGYPGETVWFDGVDEEGRQAISYQLDELPALEGYVFANMKLQSNRDAVIRLGARGDRYDLGVQSHVRLVNLDLHGGGTGRSAAIEVRRADHLKFLGVYIHDNYVAGPGQGSKYTHQIYFSDGSRDVEVGWTELARFDGGTTISIRKSRGEAPHIVHEEFDLHDMVIHDQTSGPIVFGRSAGNAFRFHHNLIYRVGKHHGLSDRAVNGNSGLSVHAYWSEQGEGDVEGGSALQLELYHNVLYDCGNQHLPGGCLQLAEARSLTMMNNIVVVKTKAPHAQLVAGSSRQIPEFQASHNLWWHPDGVRFWSSSERPEEAPNWLVGAEDLVSDPQFIDPDAELPDFRLRSTSPARGAGIRIDGYDLDAAGLRRASERVAIGAYEGQR